MRIVSDLDAINSQPMDFEWVLLEVVSGPSELLSTHCVERSQVGLAKTAPQKAGSESVGSTAANMKA